jgi:scavenger receptor class B protein 1
MKTWFFEPELSNGTLDDEIWTLNMIAISAAETTRWSGHWGEEDYPFMQFMMEESIKQANETMFMRTRIGNLTFEGIGSPLLEMGDVGGPMGDAINASIPYDKFGWFYSVSGLF